MADSDDGLAQVRDAAIRVAAALLGVPDGQKMARLKEELAKFPEPLRDPVATLVLSGMDAGRRDTMNDQQKWVIAQKLLAFVFGIGFLLLFFGVAYHPPETDFGRGILRIILPLPLAAAAAMVPGFITAESDLKSLRVRAGGAIAVFVIVYFSNPAKL